MNIWKKTLRRVLACVLAFSTAAISATIRADAAMVSNAEVKISWNDTAQEIDGFGVSQPCDVYGDEIYNHPKRDEIMDLLFSKDNGIGLSLLRCEVGNGRNMPTIEPQDGVWDFSGSAAELWVMNEAKTRGIDKIYSTVWSPPAWMKTNNKVTNGGYLRKDCYQKYAEYLKRYVEGYKQYHDIDIYAISIANEPEYAAIWQSCLWKPEMLTDFLANFLAPVLAASNTNVNVIVGEKGQWSESMVTNALNTKEACDRIDIVGGHQYSGTIGPFTLAESKGKRVWATEVSSTGTFTASMKDGISWAERVHEFMTTANANAFTYWLGACQTASNEALIRLYTDGTFETTKRLYTLGNFSRFIQPGSVRLNVDSSPAKGISLSAYKNPKTGDFSLVAINNSNTSQVLDFIPDGFAAGKLTPYVTNEACSLEEFPSIPLINGKFTVTLGAGSVTTFTGTEGSSVPVQKDWSLTDELDDWSLIYSASPDWMLEGNNPYGGFDGDPSRLRRTALSRQEVIYHFNHITDFEADVYFHDSLEGLKFYTSPDNKAWSEVNFNLDKALSTGGGWNRTKAAPADLLPPDTSYFKVEFDKGMDSWDKHLASIRFVCDAPEKPYDTLEDWSKTYEHTDNWMLDAENPDYFEGDTARARRTTATTESIIYSVPEEKTLADFTAKLFYFRTYRDPMAFYQSADGVIWTPVEMDYTGTVDTGNHWNRMYATPASDLSDCRLLKIEFSGSGLFQWDKQLSEIYFTYF